MSLTLKDIEKEALLLPPSEREILADTLTHSLCEGEGLTDIDKAWINEAENRYQNYLNGKTKGIPGDNVFAEIKQELGWQD